MEAQDNIYDEEDAFICFNQVTKDPPPQVNDLSDSQLLDEYTSTVNEINLNQDIGESSSAGNSASIAQETTSFVHAPERPSFSGDGIPVVASPEDIIPLPKIKIKRTRTRRSLKSVILTSSPHKKRLEEQDKEKLAKERNKFLKKNKKALFKPDKSKLQQAKRKTASPSSTSSDSNSYSVEHLSSDIDEPFSSKDENESANKLRLNDFAVVKIQGKTKNSVRLYISKIVRVYNDGYDAVFYKKIPGTLRFSETKEEAFLELQDIYMSLKKPIECTSGRFQNTISFSENLNDLTIY